MAAPPVERLAAADSSAAALGRSTARLTREALLLLLAGLGILVLAVASMFVGVSDVSLTVTVTPRARDRRIGNNQDESTTVLVPS